MNESTCCQFQFLETKLESEKIRMDTQMAEKIPVGVSSKAVLLHLWTSLEKSLHLCFQNISYHESHFVMLACQKKHASTDKKALFSLEAYDSDELDNLVPALNWISCLVLIPS